MGCMLEEINRTPQESKRNILKKALAEYNIEFLPLGGLNEKERTKIYARTS